MGNKKHRYTPYICRICGQQIKVWQEMVRIRPSGRTGKANTYHEKCIEEERAANVRVRT